MKVFAIGSIPPTRLAHTRFLVNSLHSAGLHGSVTVVVVAVVVVVMVVVVVTVVTVLVVTV